jgi:uncharacterized membrane protein
MAQTVFEMRREINRRLGYRGEQVLAFVRQNGERPSYGEIMKALGFSDRAGAYRAVERLERRGLL